MRTPFSFVYLLVSCILLSGCIPTQQIIAGGDGSRFVLTEDVYDFAEARWGDPWLEGLTQGEYIAVGHDEAGIYYRGPHRCLIRLPNDKAHHFLKTGERPSATENPQLVEIFYGDEGGVYVPYDLEHEQPWYFFYADYRHMTGDTDSKIPPPPASDINARTQASQPAQAVVSYPNVKVINPQDPTGQPTLATSAGTAIGVAAGRQLGTAGLRDAQGGIIRSFNVGNERILAIILKARQRQLQGSPENEW